MAIYGDLQNLVSDEVSKFFKVFLTSWGLA